MPQRFRLFGLEIAVRGAEGRFPLGIPSLGRLPPDVSIDLRSCGRLLSQNIEIPPSNWYTSRQVDHLGVPILKVHQLSTGSFWWQYHDGVEFLIDSTGTEISAAWREPANCETVLMYLTGAVLGFVLRIRGVLCLHGGALVSGERGLIISGLEGAGKSTLTAALGRLGVPIMTDDVVPLRKRHSEFMISPGPPKMMLLPNTVDALWNNPGAGDPKGDDLPSIPPLKPDWGKHRLDLTEDGPFRHYPQDIRLAAVYILEPRLSSAKEAQIAELAGADRIVKLITNTYANRILDSRMQAREFELVEQLAKAVPVRSVRGPDDLDSLGSFCDKLLADFRTLESE